MFFDIMEFSTDKVLTELSDKGCKHIIALRLFYKQKTGTLACKQTDNQYCLAPLKTAFNRTIEELKYNTELLRLGEITTFNRTIEELKLVIGAIDGTTGAPFNRTIEELKLANNAEAIAVATF